MAAFDNEMPADSGPVAPGGGESLSQAEIDRLLAESTAAAESTSAHTQVFRANGERFADADNPRVEPYDFSNPVVIDESLMRALRQRQSDFAALLSARLSIFLRMDFTLKLQRIAAQVYNRFTASITNPSHVVLFKMEPLTGVGVLDMNMQLGLAVVDRMLGGKGRSRNAIDGMTEIEMNLLEDIVLVTLEEWCRMWTGDRRLTPSLLGRETGGRYLQTSASDTVLLVAVFEGTLGETTERVQIAMPFPSVESIVRGIAAARQPATTERARLERRTSWRPAYSAIPIRMSAEWDACELSVRDVIALSPGSVVRLGRETIRETCMRVGDATKFVGEIGIENGRLAVRIDQKLSSEDV